MLNSGVFRQEFDEGAGQISQGFFGKKRGLETGPLIHRSTNKNLYKIIEANRFLLYKFYIWIICACFV